MFPHIAVSLNSAPAELGVIFSCPEEEGSVGVGVGGARAEGCVGKPAAEAHRSLLAPQPPSRCTWSLCSP